MLNIEPKQNITKKKIVVLPSFIGLPNVLNHIDLHDPNLLFISNNPSLIDFFKRTNCNYFNYPEIGQNKSSKDIREFKLRAIAFTSRFIDCELFYFFYLSDIALLFSVNLMSKQNLVAFINSDPDLPLANPIRHIFNPIYRNQLVSLLAYGLLLNFWPRIYNSGFSTLLGKKIFKENYIVQNLVSTQTQNERIIQEAFNLSEIDVLYIDNISEHFPIDAKKTSKFLDQISNKGFQTWIKPHPKIRLHDSFNSTRVLHKAVPAETVMKYAKVTIGICSMSLLYHTGGVKISIIHLLDLDDELKSRWIPAFEEYGVLMPKSSDEFFDAVYQTFKEDSGSLRRKSFNA